jgi:hypothetical protein
MDDMTPLDAIDDMELMELVRSRCCFCTDDVDDILCGGLGVASDARGFEAGAEGAGM